MTNMLLYIAIALLSAGAGFLTATIGFGGAIFLMQFLPLLLPFVVASGLSSTIVYAGILVLAWQYRRHIQWKQLWLPSVLYILVSVPSVFSLGKANVEDLRLYFSVFLILLGLYNLYKVWKAGNIGLPQNLLTTILCAVLSGLGTAFFGIGGPPMAMYFLSRTGDDKEAYVGTLQAFFAINMSLTITARFMSGVLTVELVPLMIWGMALSLLGKQIGIRLLHRLNVKALKLCVCFFMMVSGVISFIGCI